ncbi:helix-turn-helix transcriptional regulator [Acetobacter sp.]|uniref:helix-turn-helix transcriptional regulator n=1 Tax=Acetobacter sp. TaxID=440 RepID=UPI0025BE69EC|nr:hypothetical protein [Acetobacter sp.]MCH4091075.1 hypothetical protein [Acetobacter sp.]MCI1300258.1 hypothetical protein [Acetobacter sp.]MCI1316074.1 hypothetical protein [Acetobacter sp.]
MKYDALPPGVVPVLLRTEAAAALMSVAPSTLWSMAREGLVPQPFRYGRAALWNKPALEAAARRLTGDHAAGVTINESGDVKNPWDALLGK